MQRHSSNSKPSNRRAEDACCPELSGGASTRRRVLGFLVSSAAAAGFSNSTTPDPARAQTLNEIAQNAADEGNVWLSPKEAILRLRNLVDHPLCSPDCIAPHGRCCDRMCGAQAGIWWAVDFRWWDASGDGSNIQYPPNIQIAASLVDALATEPWIDRQKRPWKGRPGIWTQDALLPGDEAGELLASAVSLAATTCDQYVANGRLGNSAAKMHARRIPPDLVLQKFSPHELWREFPRQSPHHMADPNMRAAIQKVVLVHHLPADRTSHAARAGLLTRIVLAADADTERPTPKPLELSQEHEVA